MSNLFTCVQACVIFGTVDVEIIPALNQEKSKGEGVSAQQLNQRLTVSFNSKKENSLSMT